ncbi:hypothetical protein KIL84_005506 [Mauremys mutica]|uniref:Uncharacterized protein n=1 Tax=Mauremys mutica TaxID=74926 RepID=A0A9D3XMF1_9SAUR|nr:hypothetical protein KIL84_005506 [Mauremys mutica]
MFGSFPSACKLVFTVQFHTLLAWKRTVLVHPKKKHIWNLPKKKEITSTAAGIFPSPKGQWYHCEPKELPSPPVPSQ